MDSKRWWKSPGLVGVCVLSVVLCGCTSADLLARKDREITELKSEEARLRESLSQSIAKIDRLREGVKAVQRDKRNAVEEAEDLRKRVSFVNEQLEVAARERSKLETRLQDAEAQVSMLERSLAKVKDVASDSVSELTDLRLRAENFREELVKLRSDNQALSQTRAKLQKEAEDQQDELIKLKAVLRALRSGSKEKALQERIAQLQKEAADLRGENIALSMRYENLSAREAELSKALAKQAKGASDGTTPAVTSASPAADELVYVSDPVGLFDEVCGFARARYRKALTGEMTWDLFDKSVVVAAGLVLVLLIGYLVRSRRIYKLKREVQDLRAELYELEEEPEVEGDDYEDEEEERRARGPRKRPTLRRGGFSAVIAGPGGPPPAASAPSETPERVPEMVAAAAPPRAASPAAAPAPPPPPAPAPAQGEDAEGDSRRVIGARTWEDEESMSLDEESLERTQIIQVSPEELTPEKLLVPSIPKADDSTASSTSPSTSPDQKTKEMKKGASLLDELKSAVNDKLDNL